MSAIDDLSKKKDVSELEGIIIFAYNEDVGNAEKAADELAQLQAQNGRMIALLQTIFDEGEGGEYRGFINQVLVEANK